LRVISWNLARNTTSRRFAVHEQAWHFLAALDPDIALMQEAEPLAWVKESWQVVMTPLATWGWGSAVLAKPGMALTAAASEPQTEWDRTGLIATAALTMKDGAEMLLGSVDAPLMKTKSPSDERLSADTPSPGCDGCA
jgi:hypothetical protein